MSTSSSATLYIDTKTPGTSASYTGNNIVYAAYIKPTKSASLTLTSRGNAYAWIVWSINGSTSWTLLNPYTSTTYTKSLDSSYDFIMFFKSNTGGSNAFNVTYSVS